MPPKPPNHTETIEITNFGGRLTRKLNGELNSGYAKFNTSFGYDPFSKPDNLTWFETPVDITGPITGLVLDAETKSNTSGDGQAFVYTIDTAGKLIKIQPNLIGTPNLDSVVGIGSVTSGSPSYQYGASLEIAGSGPKAWIASDQQINRANLDGSSDTVVANAANLVNTYHPLRQFLAGNLQGSGQLIVGNGNTVATIDLNTNTVTSSIIGTGQLSGGGNPIFSALNPALSSTQYVHDLDLSPDGNNLLITASNLNNEAITVALSDYPATSGSSGYLHGWNGADNSITTTMSIPSYAVTALQTYLDRNMFFSNDSFGASLNDGSQKKLTLINNKSPLPNATTVNGNFVSWANPETSPDGTTINASMYYFGGLDQENPPGLYRLFRMASQLASGFIYQVPVNILTNNKYSAVNSGRTAVSAVGYGKHYFSTWEMNAGTPTSYKLYRFLVTSSGTGTPQLGVYETQTQLFSKRVTVKQIRVYTEPTVANNGFQVDVIGTDGAIVTNGTFNYTFAAGSDPTLLQGAQQRIDFNPATGDQFGFGIRITNTGTANMTIKKIECDWMYSGK